jgi:hypothetical protein
MKVKMMNVIVVKMTITVMVMDMIKILMTISQPRVDPRSNKRKEAKVVLKDNNKNASSNELICLSS